MEDPPMDSSKKSLDQLLGQAFAERSREDDQVEVTYELGGGDFTYDKQQRLKPSDGSSRTPSLKEDPDEENSGTPSSVELERRAQRGVLTLGVALVLCTNGIAALQGLQSSAFPGAGTDALAALHSLAALSCLCAPAVVRTAGTRVASAPHTAASLAYLGAFWVGGAPLLVACSAILGSTLGPALCALDTRLSVGTHRSLGRHRLLKRFRVVAGTSALWGNLVASLVVGRSGGDQLRSVEALASVNVTSDDQMSTSAVYDFCFEFLEDSGGGGFRDFTIRFNSMNPESVRTLVLIFASSIIAGASLVLFFLERIDPLVQQDPLERPLLLQTLRQIRLVLVDKEIRLAVPLVVFIGIEQGFIIADFTRSYVSCSLGLESVVLTMLCLAVCNTLGTVAVHLFSEHIQRTVIMAAGLVCQSGLLMVLYLWTPVKDDAAVFYVIAGGWGLCNAIWETLTITYIASTYNDDWQVPFSTHRFLQCLGMATSFSISNYLGSQTKVCFLAATLALSMLPYTVLEFRIHHRSIVQNRTAVL